MINIDYILELMKKSNMTLGQLSVKSGVSKAQLSRLLNNKRHAGGRTIKGLLRAFPDADKNILFLL